MTSNIIRTNETADEWRNKMTLKIKLSGDHSDYHCGSAAAFRAIKKEAARHGRIVHDEDFDLLIVNGEGSMHHGSAACRRKMKEIEQALKTGKRVRLVNTVWQSNPREYSAILRQCEEVVARDVISLTELKGLGIRARFALDQSFHDELDEQAELIDYSQSLVFTDFYSSDFSCFVYLNAKWANQFPALDMQHSSWSSVVRSLRTASLLVTGRHHAVYAACRARTPFLALAGNTHKIEGLIKASGAQIEVFHNLKKIKAAVENGRWVRDEYEKLFDWMEQQEPWRLEAIVPKNGRSRVMDILRRR